MKLLILIVACIACGVLTSSAALAAATPAPMNMNMPMPMNTAPAPHAQAMHNPEEDVASPVTGTQWSVFNHRGVGFFLFLWGLTALIVGLQWPRRTWFRFVPPVVLLGLIEFFILRNDPKAWPIGPYG